MILHDKTNILYSLEIPHPFPGFVEIDFKSKIPRCLSEYSQVALENAVGEMRNNSRAIGSEKSGPFIEKYLNGLSITPANWCSGFISWCFNQHPNGAPFKYSITAWDLLQEIRKNKFDYCFKSIDPHLGDLVFWKVGDPTKKQIHVGIIYSCHYSNIITIEGNRWPFPRPVRMFKYCINNMDNLITFARI